MKRSPFMSRLVVLSLVLNLISLACFGYYVSTTRAAASNSSYLPIVAAPEDHPYLYPSVCDGKKPIWNEDTGALAAGLTANGQWKVAFQDRQRNSRIFVTTHVSDTLTEFPIQGLAEAQGLRPEELTLSGPPLSPVDSSSQPTPTAILVPQFSPTPIKGGAVAIVIDEHGHDRLYFTQRDPNDDTPNEGPYAIWCVTF